MTAGHVVDLEVASLVARADPALNAIKIEAVDEGGAGCAFLIGPPQARDLVVRLLNELGHLVPR